MVFDCLQHCRRGFLSIHLPAPHKRMKAELLRGADLKEASLIINESQCCVHATVAQ